MNIKSHENAVKKQEIKQIIVLLQNITWWMILSRKLLLTALPGQAFRSGFREGVKMSLQWGQQISLNKENFNSALGRQNRSRLKIWCEVGADATNGYWAILGARLGLKMNMIDLFNHQSINSYEWLDNCLYTQVLKPLGLTQKDMDHPEIEKKLICQINQLGSVLNERLPFTLRLLTPDESLSFKKNFINPKRSGLLGKDYLF